MRDELDAGKYNHLFTHDGLASLIRKWGKTNKQIAEEVILFCNEEFDGKHEIKILGNKKTPPVFYAYYADYDWVVFCWLFGNMMSLPKGFPMYCRDLKQILDEKVICHEDRYMDESVNFETRLAFVKHLPGYPKQDESSAHSAIEDARWDKLLHEFLKDL